MTLPIFHSNNVPHSQSDYLSELWRKIEKNERRNQRAELKVNQLFSEYKDKLTPHDKKLDHLHCAWVKHLMSFLTSKKLKTNIRNRLMQAIEQELIDLLDRPFINDRDKVEALCEEYETYHNKVFQKEKQQALNAACREFENGMKEMFGADIDLPHKKIREILASGDPFAIEAFISALWASFVKHNNDSFSPRAQNEDDWDDWDDWDDFEFDYFESEDDDALNIKEMFRGTQLNKMYKRIASVIHPDKESDPLKKEEKHRLMQKLAVAKRENDVMTLVRMLTEYVPDSEHLLDETTLVRMEHLLEMKLLDLNRAHRDIFSQQGVKSQVWRQFSAPSKKKTQAKMEKYIEVIDDSIVSLEKRIRKVNSINQLKKYLGSLTFY
ncbi:Molecular chaperone DnaJ [Vibrio crassostreae]|nr:Molecular chaperone DnaJ [Vibrio crassostreae]